jgi:hypothetical protein
MIGGQLALEEAWRKVPERPLAALGLVDGQAARAAERELRQKGCVARSRQPALEGDIATG